MYIYILFGRSILERLASQYKLHISNNAVHLAAIEYSYATLLSFSAGFPCLYNPVQI